ncbi:hypothetical protein NDU88_012964 [Pleurodeles waltl]|uniref:Uncharacterized protein n=1 Tax=Pleurodeles waltl TaxID=8319 RepID=A0AAV7R2B0_PLEWA|nr:hypothetical protein NDU88_012964 [Pleurodeles waltl]
MKRAASPIRRCMCGHKEGLCQQGSGQRACKEDVQAAPAASRAESGAARRAGCLPMSVVPAEETAPHLYMPQREAPRCLPMSVVPAEETAPHLYMPQREARRCLPMSVVPAEETAPHLYMPQREARRLPAHERGTRRGDGPPSVHAPERSTPAACP